MTSQDPCSLRVRDPLRGPAFPPSPTRSWPRPPPSGCPRLRGRTHAAGLPRPPSAAAPGRPAATSGAPQGAGASSGAGGDGVGPARGPSVRSGRRRPRHDAPRAPPARRRDQGAREGTAPARRRADDDLLRETRLSGTRRKRARQGEARGGRRPVGAARHPCTAGSSEGVCRGRGGGGRRGRRGGTGLAAGKPPPAGRK